MDELRDRTDEYVDREDGSGDEVDFVTGPAKEPDGPAYGEEGYERNADFGSRGEAGPSGKALVGRLGELGRSAVSRARGVNAESGQSGEGGQNGQNGQYGEGAGNGPDPSDDRTRLTRLLIGAGIALAALLLIILLINAFSRLAGPGSKNGAPAAAPAASEAESAPAETESAEAPAKEADLAESAASGAADAEDARGVVIPEAEPADSDLTIVEVAQRVMPSMVSLTNVSETEYRTFFGEPQVEDSVSAGSGIIIGQSEDRLLIATNAHVIQGARDLTVGFVDETTAPAEVIGADSETDLAVVSVSIAELSDKTRAAVRIVRAGDSDKLLVGEPVVAIGNALGYGQSVSSGIVSATGRTLQDSDGSVRSVIQTDASINPGNSGGALLNMRGELIGINEAKSVNMTIEGIGYAIPISVAKPVLEEIAGRRDREPVPEDQASYLGITCMTMPSYYTQMGYPYGVYVSEVVADGPSQKAGLKEQDVITSMDGIGIYSQEELLEQLACYAAGETIDLGVSRMKEDGTFEKIHVTVELGRKPDAAGSGAFFDRPLFGREEEAAGSAAESAAEESAAAESGAAASRPSLPESEDTRSISEYFG